MAKFVGLLMCLALIVHAGFSLKCYHCHAGNVDGCIKSANLKEVQCGNPVIGTKVVCFYKHSYVSTINMDIVNATCALLPAHAELSALPDCQQPGRNIEVKECRVCDFDLCNSAPPVSKCLPVTYFANNNTVVDVPNFTICR